MMSFREKRAWVTLITLIVLLILFGFHYPPQSMLRPQPNVFLLHVLALMLTVFVVVEIIARIVFMIRFPRDARTPKDEREHLIDLKSIAIAWYVYAILTIVGIFVVIHLGANAVGVWLVVLLSFVIAQIVNFASRIYYYRRGF
jgi:hypothetical protein